MAPSEASSPLTSPSRRPPWGTAFRWACWLALGYAVPLVAGRAVVTYRFGGLLLAPHFYALLLGAAALALAQWPMLALAARGEGAVRLMRSILQWTAVAGLSAYLLLALGALWLDPALELIARYVAPDVTGVR